jgi:pimeloyl-ACP methyl ester carboxylesterase
MSLMNIDGGSIWRAARLCASALLGGVVWGGCSVADLATSDRYAAGLVVVLPGIEGRSIYNTNIARGLGDGYVDSAIEIFDWGVDAPGGFLVNLTALERNRHQGERLAERIIRYQDAFPGRPVHVIGHSGGAGIALLALECLPEDRSITAAYLLAAAVSPDYDLAESLKRTDLGIWNFYSSKDVGFLGWGTSMFGTIDRSHTRAAGAVGFRLPPGLSEDGLELYETKLHDVPYNRRMARAGCDGSHLGWARHEFAKKWLAAMILSDVKSVRTLRYVTPRAGESGADRSLKLSSH